MQMKIGNIIYYNYEEKYEDIVDHCSYIHNLSIAEVMGSNPVQA